MIVDLITELAQSPWVLPALFVLVLLDSLLVVIPGEIAVTALGALAVSVGSPSLAGVILVAAAAAFSGDALCYLLGRTVGLERWGWMRAARVQKAFAWAAARLDRSTAVVVFAARFVPFARLAVNLTAGATKLSAPRYLTVAAIAATAWAAYQAVIGAAIGALLPDAPLLAVAISIVLAIGLGAAIDAVLARRDRARARDAD